MRANRGAARVSLTWLIVLIVFFLVAMVFAFISQTDLTKAKNSALADRDKAVAAEERYLELDTKYRDLVESVGWYDKEGAVREVATADVQAAIDSLRADFPDISAEAKDLQSVIPAVTAERRRLVEELDAVRSQVSSLETELSTEREARSADVAAKDEGLNAVRTELADTVASAEERQSELEGRVTASDDQNTELDSQLRAVQREMEETLRTKDQHIAELTARLAILGERESLRAAKGPITPDGSILSISDQLGVAWIDIGSKNRVIPGLSFDVKARSASGVAHTKAKATVVDVEDSMAKVTISGVVDPFDPVNTGDAVVNEIFDPSGERIAVLAGDFSGSVNEKDLTLLLAGMGVRVQSKLDKGTDMLILGNEIYVDEFGDPYDEPLQPSDLPVYGAAESLGVSIVPYNLLRKYIQF